MCSHCALRIFNFSVFLFRRLSETCPLGNFYPGLYFPLVSSVPTPLKLFWETNRFPVIDCTCGLLFRMCILGRGRSLPIRVRLVPLDPPSPHVGWGGEGEPMILQPSAWAVRNCGSVWPLLGGTVGTLRAPTGRKREREGGSFSAMARTIQPNG